ncbi:MAG: GYD domain-containing protein [Acidimicrobiia bacterium]
MATFITLVNFTDQGIRNFKDTTKRAQAFRDLVEEMGGRLKDIYWTLGGYDVVAIMEAPDDETATAVALKTSSLGNVRTTTLRGFNEQEVKAIIDKVS